MKRQSVRLPLEPCRFVPYANGSDSGFFLQYLPVDTGMHLMYIVMLHVFKLLNDPISRFGDDYGLGSFHNKVFHLDASPAFQMVR